MTKYKRRGEYEAWRVGDNAGTPEWVLLTSQLTLPIPGVLAAWSFQYCGGDNETLSSTAYAGDWAVRDENGFVSVWSPELFAARFEPLIKDGTE